MKNRSRWMVTISSICLLICILTGCGNKDFDATAYTQAVLALEFQGITDDARAFEGASSTEDLKNQYFRFVNEVSTLFTSDINLSDEQFEEYNKVVATLLQSMRYEVGEAKKTGKTEYVVPITVWPNDTLLLYKRLLTRDSLVIAEQIEKGEIKGSKEEISEEVKSMISEHAADLLEKAFSSSDYGEPVTINVKLLMKNDAYELDGDDMSKLIVKILRFDEGF